jgi:hypothetical protein
MEAAAQSQQKEQIQHVQLTPTEPNPVKQFLGRDACLAKQSTRAHQQTRNEVMMNSPPRAAAVHVSEIFIGHFEVAMYALLDVTKSDSGRIWFQPGAAGPRRIQYYLPDDELASIQHCESLVTHYMSLQTSFTCVATMEFYSRYLIGVRYLQRLSKALKEIVEKFHGCVKCIRQNDEQEFLCAARKYRRRAKLKWTGRWKGLARGKGSPLRQVTSAEPRDLDELTEATYRITWGGYIMKCA